MKWIFASFLLLTSCTGFGAQWFVTQSGTGRADGTSLGDAWSVSNYNRSGVTTEAGDTVNISGAIAQEIKVPTGGTLGKPITIVFLPGANVTVPVISGPSFPDNAAIYAAYLNFLTIDGGSNGVIQCTDNGSVAGFSNHSSKCNGISLIGCGNVIVQNLLIANLYVCNSVVDKTGGGTGIFCKWNGGSSPSPANTNIVNCVFHDMYIGFGISYGPASSNITMASCTAYNCNWGGNAGNGGPTASLTGLSVHDNLFYNWSNWNTTADTYHHNGFYAWAENGGTLTNPVFYNNTVGPGYGGAYQTGGIFCSCHSGTMIGTTIYNNLFICNPGERAGNGLLTVRGESNLKGTHNWYNNTFIGGGTEGNMIYVGGGLSSATINIKNNLCEGNGGGTFIAIFGRANLTINSDYNVCADLKSSHAFSFSSNASANYRTFVQWQALGFEMHSSSIAAKFISPGTHDFHLARADIAATQKGEDLSSAFTTDKDGVARPQGHPWCIGCYEQTMPTAVGTGQKLSMIEKAISIRNVFSEYSGGKYL
jgi:hypothetical protein